MKRVSLFSRNFMKEFPIRKYGDITAKSMSWYIQPEASVLTIGCETKLSWGPENPSSMFPLQP